MEGNTRTHNQELSDDQPDFSPEDIRPIQPRPWYKRVGRRLAAFIFIAAMLFFGGIYQFGLLQKTPEDASVRQYQPVISAPAREIPATVFVLQRQGATGTTSMRRLVNKANKLLQQANVTLQPVRIRSVSANSSQSQGTTDTASGPATESGKRPGHIAASPKELRSQLPELNSDRLNIVVTTGLAGINGVAFPGQQVVAVAEYTSTFDFRVLAHEVGHILSLEHVSDKSNLMFSGSSGTELKAGQAREANRQAQSFLRGS